MWYSTVVWKSFIRFSFLNLNPVRKNLKLIFQISWFNTNKPLKRQLKKGKHAYHFCLILFVLFEFLSSEFVKRSWILVFTIYVAHKIIFQVERSQDRWMREIGDHIQNLVDHNFHSRNSRESISFVCLLLWKKRELRFMKSLIGF